MNETIKRLFGCKYILLAAMLSAMLPSLAYKPATRSDLSNLCARTIAQDAHGFIWIGTANGLCKSYGNEYEIYFGDINDTSTIPSNSVLRLQTASDGNMYVSTNVGLCVLRPGSKTFTRLVPDNGEKHFCAFGIVEFDNRIFGYGDEGLYELLPDSESLKLCFRVNGDQVTSAAVADGLLWLSNGSSLTAVDPKMQTATRVVFSDAERIKAMTAADGKLFLGNPMGMLKFDPKTLRTSPTAISGGIDVRELTVDGSKMLVSTGNRGVLIYDLKGDTVSSSIGAADFRQVQSSEINSVFRDRSGHYWVGTFDRGEVTVAGHQGMFNPDSRKAKAFRNNFVTRATYDSHGNLWTGTRRSGIGVLDRNATTPHFFNSATYPALGNFHNDFVQELYFDSSGRLWIGYNNSLLVCQPHYTPGGSVQGFSIIKTFPVFIDVVSIAEDAKGQMWVGTPQNGLFIIDKDLSISRNITHPLLKSNNITRSIRYGDDHMLVSAYSDNLYLIDIHGYTIRAFEINEPLASANAIDMMFDDERNLWIGTYHHGIFRMDAKTKKTEACLDTDQFYDIVALAKDANGDIWASSSYGLYRFGKNGDALGNYLAANGLGGNQFHEKCVAYTPDGKINFGGNNGLEEVAVKSGASKNKVQEILLVLKDLTLLPDDGRTPSGLKGDTDFAELQEIKLNHNENSVSLEFFAIDYNPFSDIEYAYMLKGRDKDFISSGAFNKVSYSDLTPGNYEFFVKARHKGHEWQDPEKLLSMTVKPNPWFSLPAKIIYFLIFAFLIFAANHIYLRFRLLKQRFSLSEERMRQEKALQANRIQFFTNISHELRTPLTLISGPAENLRKNFRSMPEERIEESFDFIDSNIKRLLTLIDQLLSFRKVNGETLPLKVSHADLRSQLDGLAHLYAAYAVEHSVEITLDAPDGFPQSLVYDNDKVEKIVGNLIVNAVKYSNDNGTIRLTLDTAVDPEGLPQGKGITYASISVADNGKGMDEEDIPKIFLPFMRILKLESVKKTEGFGIGLNFVKHLVAEHRGIIKTVRNPEGGMTFTVIIPVSENAFAESEFKETDPDALPPHDDTAAASASKVEEFEGQELANEIDTDETGIGMDDETMGETDADNADDDQEETLPKILVVEDNVPLNTFISGLFRDNFTVIQATNGGEGLQMALDECPDIIISDIKMPGDIDGYTLCGEVKSNPSTSHIPVVLLTAKTLDENKIKGYQCGTDAYITKPFSPEVLVACVNNLNNKRKDNAALVLATAGHNEQEDIRERVQQDISPLDKRFLDKLYAYLENNLDNCDLNVNMLGRELGFSRTNFYRKVKALTNVSPTDLLRVYRLNRAAELLLTREYTVGEVSEKVGFVSQSHFSSLFRKHFNVSPRTYVSNHFG